MPDRPTNVVIAMQATALAVSGAVGITVLRIFDPNIAGSVFPTCPFFALTGHWCIGCGMTRAAHALAHGDLGLAFSMNPLVVTLLALSPIMLGWYWGWKPRLFRPLMSVLGEPRFWLVLLPVYWIARNLPWAPFTWLAPG